MYMYMYMHTTMCINSALPALTHTTQHTCTQNGSEETQNGVQKRKKEDFTFDKIIGEGSYSTVRKLASAPCTQSCLFSL